MATLQNQTTLQKSGGLAALAEGLAYIIGFTIMGVFSPENTAGWNAAQKLAYVLDHKTLTYFWSILFYVCSIALVVMAVALHERLSKRSAELMKIATPFALIWAGLLIASGMISQIGVDAVAQLHAQDIGQAVSAWTSLVAVQDGLGGGVELVGGVWVLLISVAVFRAEPGARALAGLGGLVGAAGVLTAIPQLQLLTVVFGLSQIIWFVWIGIWMLRAPSS